MHHEPSATGIHLRRTSENGDEIAALAQLLDTPPGLLGLLEDLKYQLRPARVVPRLLGRAVREAYAFDAYDQRDRSWYPQGISTSADATDDEVVGGRRVLVTTWYSTGNDGVKRGSRVTFIDLATGRYRHVLLVVPVFDAAGALQLKTMNIHAGGIVWAGPYLHIAATRRGFITARVEDIMGVAGDEEQPHAFGIAHRRVASFGHRYVLPVRFTYQAHTDEGHHQLRYSFMSLNRSSSPPELVAGEYAANPDQTTRLTRYALDPHTWQLQSGHDGSARPLTLNQGVTHMQGVAIVNDRHYVSVSHGPFPGSIHEGRPGALRARRWALPMGPEDLAYWPSTDRLWSLTEHPRRRWIVSMDRAWLDPP